MSAPKRIYLQDVDAPVETTWCADKIEDDDVEYVRADVMREEVATMIEAEMESWYAANGMFQTRDAIDWLRTQDTEDDG